MAEEETKIPESGVQISPTVEPEQEEEDVGIELGDTLVIKGGPRNKFRGKVYDIRADRILVQPFDTPTLLFEIPIVETEEGPVPDPDLGIEELVPFKALVPGFLAMVDLQNGQIIGTYLKGEPVAKYLVTEVYRETDAVDLRNIESGEEVSLTFGFQGLSHPDNKNINFDVIQIIESPASTENAEQDSEANAAARLAEQQSLGPVSNLEYSEEDVENDGQLPSRTEEQAISEENQGQEEPVGVLVEGEIELDLDEELEGKNVEFETASDQLQRKEFLSQLFRLLPEAQRRNPAALQKERILREIFFILRNRIVDYGPTGIPRGIRATSLETLAEMIQQLPVPMSRKVVAAKRTAYFEHSQNHYQKLANPQLNPDMAFDRPAGFLTDQFDFDYDYDLLKRAEALDEEAKIGGGEQSANVLPKFYSDKEKYRLAVHKPYTLHTGGLQQITIDQDVFREYVPDFDEKKVEGIEYFGMMNTLVTPAQNYNIFLKSFDMFRLLEQRYARFRKGQPYRVIEPADVPLVKTTLLFPPAALRDLGPIRSGILAQDMSLAMTQSTLMSDLLKELGEVTDFLSADSILSIGAEGNILGNVMLADWLNQMNMRLTGLGDVNDKLRSYGMHEIELNVEQAKKLQEKVVQYLANLRIFIKRQREENKAKLANLKFEAQDLLSDANRKVLEERVQGEPYLKSVFADLKEAIGDLAKIDLNWFAFMFSRYPDFLLAVLGQKENTVVRERLRTYTDRILEAPRIAQQIEDMKKEEAYPTPHVKCPHYKDLEANRKAIQALGDDPSDTTRVRLMLRLLEKYRGITENNWIDCNKCKQHLMCAHEHLQIQEFLNPKQKDTLHKELLIKFSGSVFAGKFICRVCGQAIQDMEFDKNLEFDEDGRPLMSRAVMVDEDQIDIDEEEDMLMGPSAPMEEMDYGSEENNLMYKALNNVCTKMGIRPSEIDYEFMMMQLSSLLATLPSREQYAEEMAGKQATDYDVNYAITYVAMLAAVVLVDIQTKIPDYVVYYENPECREGFYGFPLEENGKEGGIQSVAAVCASIDDKIYPWDTTSLQRSKSYAKRKEVLLRFIKPQLERYAVQPMAARALQKKRERQAEIGPLVATNKKELIADTFRPIPYLLTEEEAAQDIVIPEAASPAQQATAWIRVSHGIAKKSAPKKADAPRAETTCCLHPITSPADFWTKQSLPTLEPKVAGQGQVFSLKAEYYYTPDTLTSLDTMIDPRDYYQLFAKLCWKGENKGLPHELGMSLFCSRCGLNFRENPHLPVLIEVNETDKNKREKMIEQAKEKAAADLKGHIESQGVVINEDTFQDLLAEARQRGSLPADEEIPIPKSTTLFQTLASLEPAPVNNWILHLQTISKALDELGATATKIQIAQAAEEFVTEIISRETFLRGKLPKEIFDILKAIPEKKSLEIKQILSTYILVPFSRWLNQMNPKDSYKILATYNLSSLVQEDILKKGLGNYWALLGNGESLKGLLKRKVRQMVADFSVFVHKVLPLLQNISLVPGGSVVATYLHRAYIMGYLSKFYNANDVPPGDEEIETGPMTNMKLLVAALTETLQNYKKTSAIPTEDEIRFNLEKRAAVEKELFKKKLKGMTREERQVAQELKRRRMGDWAVGGSLSIRKHDNDRYEDERVERVDAGFDDYPEFNEANAAEQRGRVYDLLGFTYEGPNEEEGETGDGYDMEEMREEDY